MGGVNDNSGESGGGSDDSSDGSSSIMTSDEYDTDSISSDSEDYGDSDGDSDSDSNTDSEDSTDDSNSDDDNDDEVAAPKHWSVAKVAKASALQKACVVQYAPLTPKPDTRTSPRLREQQEQAKIEKIKQSQVQFNANMTVTKLRNMIDESAQCPKCLSHRVKIIEAQRNTDITFECNNCDKIFPFETQDKKLMGKRGRAMPVSTYMIAVVSHFVPELEMEIMAFGNSVERV